MNRQHCIRMLLLMEPASMAELVAATGWPRQVVHNTVGRLSVMKHIKHFDGAWEITDTGASYERMTQEERDAKFGKRVIYAPALQFRSVFDYASA